MTPSKQGKGKAKQSLADKPAAKSPTPRKAAKPALKPANSQRPPAPSKEAKARKVKLIDDKFTMPKPDYDLIDGLKRKCFLVGAVVKKNDLLRAGLRALDALPVQQLESALLALGPPRKKKKRAKK
jgi:hypothetical protein